MLIACVNDTKKETLLKANNADIIEFRDDIIDFEELKNKKFSSVLLTFKKNKNDKKFIFYFLKKIKPEYIDLEYDTDKNIFLSIKKHFPDIKIIVSYHNYEKTSINLEKILNSMPKGDFYKIVCFAKNSIDSLKMINFLKNKKNVCGICLGKMGEITRILSFLYTPFTYTKINKPTALGQIDLYEMKKRYFFHKKNKDTKIFALIGDVKKSPSHIVHNKIFSLSNENAIYVKIPLKKSELSDFFLYIKSLPFYGISVTMPLKEEIRYFINKNSFESINTLFRKKDNWIGFNTDINAISLIEKKISIKGKKVFIIGAGGSSKALAYEAKKKKADVYIFNRTFEKAKILKEKIDPKSFHNKVFLLEELEKHNYFDVLINTTPLDLGKKFLFKNFFKKDQVVMDLLIEDTKFLKIARKNDCKIIHGFEVFVSQARGQFKKWFF